MASLYSSRLNRYDERQRILCGLSGLQIAVVPVHD